DRVAVECTEPRRRAELPDLRPRDFRIEPERDECRVPALPPRSRPLVRPELDDATGASIVRRELGTGDRPAAVGHPVANLEVDRVEGRAEAGPMPGRAAEVMQPRRLKREIGQSDDLAAIEILHAGVVIEATALE